MRHRNVPTHAARRSQQLVGPIFFGISANKTIFPNSGNQTQGPTLVVVFEGNHYQVDRPPGRPAPYNSLETINQQSATRSTSSRKQHKTICQLCTNATALFPVDRGKRPKQQRRQRSHSNSKAPLPHCRYSSIEYSRGKEPPNDAIPGRMHAAGFFRGYRLCCLLYDLRVARLNNRNDFPPCF